MFAVQVNEGFLQQLSDLDYKLSWARAQADQAAWQSHQHHQHQHQHQHLDYKLSWARAQADQAAWQDHQQLTREISNLQNIVLCQKQQY